MDSARTSGWAVRPTCVRHIRAAAPAWRDVGPREVALGGGRGWTRAALFLAAPNTRLGLALALLALPGGRLSVVDGVIEARGPILRWLLRRLTLVPGGAVAMTIGHLVLGADAHALAATRAHERVHVRQYERWGVFFIPAYVGAGLWSLVRGGDPYVHNPFEREARTVEHRATDLQPDVPCGPPWRSIVGSAPRSVSAWTR